MFIVQKEEIRVSTTDIFTTPLMTFELPSFIAEFAHHFIEAPSPPPSRTCPFNKLVLDFLDIEAKQGEDSDKHGSPNC